jgi:hypothetical protein
MKGGTDGATATNRDVELVAPRRGAAGLWRRANVKTLIANTTGKAGLPVNIRIGPPLSHPRIEAAAPRNAIAITLPGRALAGATTGSRSTGIGAPAGSAGSPTLQMHALPNAGVALRGAAINGTTMGRIAAGSIGGPAKDRSGINGTLMRPRH